MLPLGLMLIAADVAFLQRTMARLTIWGANRLDLYRERRAMPGMLHLGRFEAAERLCREEVLEAYAPRGNGRLGILSVSDR